MSVPNLQVHDFTSSSGNYKIDLNDYDLPLHFGGSTAVMGHSILQKERYAYNICNPKD